MMVTTKTFKVAIKVSSKTLEQYSLSIFAAITCLTVVLFITVILKKHFVSPRLYEETK